MNIVRRTLDIDTETDARLREMADERGQDVAAVLAEAVALLDSVVDIAGPDIGEDRRRLDAFKQTRAAVPLDDVKSWVASWGSANELPRPAPRENSCPRKEISSSRGYGTAARHEADAPRANHPRQA
jgi:predicted transcriptional regulator